MASENHSPSYLAERERVRKWLERTSDGREAIRILKGGELPSRVSAVLDDDVQTDWEEIVKDYRGASVLVKNCRAAQEAFELARQSHSNMGPPMADKKKWVKFFSAPVAYVLRRQIETCDPDYWNDPINTYREALSHPEWCTAPADYIRGSLENFLPRGQQVA